MSQGACLYMFILHFSPLSCIFVLNRSSAAASATAVVPIFSRLFKPQVGGSYFRCQHLSVSMCSLPAALFLCVTAGRSLNIGTSASTGAPTFVPWYLLPLLLWWNLIALLVKDSYTLLFVFAFAHAGLWGVLKFLFPRITILEKIITRYM